MAENVRIDAPVINVQFVENKVRKIRLAERGGFEPPVQVLARTTV